MIARRAVADEDRREDGRDGEEELEAITAKRKVAPQPESTERTEKETVVKRDVDSCEIRTHAGFPNNLAGYRLNHSAKLSYKRTPSTHSCPHDHPLSAPSATHTHPYTDRQPSRTAIDTSTHTLMSRSVPQGPPGPPPSQTQTSAMRDSSQTG